MTIVLSIIIFVLGAVGGALAFKFIFLSSTDYQALSEKVAQAEAELAQYKMDVADHLNCSAKLLEQMNDTCQAAMAQMEKSTQLLQQATPKDISTMPFFSIETQEQLAQTVKLRHNKNDRKGDVQITEPPLDYSGESSGLFIDKKQTVTNPTS